MNGSGRDARDAIFENIRSSLRRDALDTVAAAALDLRIAHAPRHTRPALRDDLVTQLVEKFQARGGSVASLARLDELPAMVSSYLAENDLPGRIALAEPLSGLAWPAHIERRSDAAGRGDLVAVSVCIMGIAETGSLLFCSGPDSPTTHNFVPDHHIVVLRRGDIVRHLEDAWAQLRQRDGGMPRAVNIVSGPSRTGDIEQTIQLGAHGPRRVHVLMCD
ncbi:MAG TPA: LUD domain-containing protein [Rhodocyclaceae bacterium]|nr:LUD domain-containing protein [Rhodocyclaceae bacterium]